MARLNLIKPTLHLPPLHPLQGHVAHHPARYRVIAAGRRWGKSRLAAALCLHAALRPPGGRVFWIAPTYKIAEVGWREIKGLARQLNATIHEQDKRAGFGQTRGWIQVRSADDPQSLRGEGLNFVVFDECAYTKEESWTEAIRPALADRQGRALFISSPNGKNWFHRLWEYGRNGIPDWQSWQFPTASNPYIPPAEIEAARAEMFSLTFQQEFLAEFVDATGAALKREWLATGEPAGKPPVVLGVDLALSTKTEADWTAIVALSRDAAGTVYVRDAQRIRAPFHQVLQFIQQMASKWNPAIIAIESVQYQAAVVQELLRTTRLPVRGVRPDKDKLTRFLPLAARYEQGLVKHAPGLPGWFEDELLAFPVGDHDDGCLIAGTRIETNKGSVPIEKIKSGDFVLTRQGYRRVLNAGMTSASAKVITIILSNGIRLTGTGNHPVMVENGWSELRFVKSGDILSILDSVHFKENLVCDFVKNKQEEHINVSEIWSNIVGFVSIGIRILVNLLIETILLLESKIVQMGLIHFIGKYGRMSLVTSPMDGMFITKMEIHSTIRLKTLNWFLHQHMLNFILKKPVNDQSIQNKSNTLTKFVKKLLNGMGAKQELNGIRNMERKHGKIVRIGLLNARCAVRNIKPVIQELRFIALQTVIKKCCGLLENTRITSSSALVAEKISPLQKDNNVVPCHVLHVIEEPSLAAVFNLTVDDVHEYYANGILVHNCDAAAHAWAALGMLSGGPVALKVAAL